MLKKGKSKKKSYMMLKCEWCGCTFKAEHFRKYCRTKCSKEVNAKRSQGRYRTLRDAYLKAQGKLY